MYDTLPLDAVFGRCLVLDAKTYSQGRPKYPVHADEDVYICLRQLDNKQGLYRNMIIRNLPRIPKTPYIFDKFPTMLKMKRNFSVSNYVFLD